MSPPLKILARTLASYPFGFAEFPVQSKTSLCLLILKQTNHKSTLFPDPILSTPSVYAHSLNRHTCTTGPQEMTRKKDNGKLMEWENCSRTTYSNDPLKTVPASAAYLGPSFGVNKLSGQSPWNSGDRFDVLWNRDKAKRSEGNSALNLHNSVLSWGLLFSFLPSIPLFCL